eukprot:m.103022 g.103022  ORF g.103022 m.103022 type:complete len:264 (+) comp16834_c0_seq1:46-837(+)
MLSQLVFSRWFILNAILSVMHPIIRSTPLNDKLFGDNVHSRGLSYRELEILTFLGVVITMKARRIANSMELYSTVFKFCILANCVMFFLLDGKALMIYLLLWFFVYITAPELVYSGPEKAPLVDHVELLRLIAKDEASVGDAYHVVEFLCTWSPPCQFLAPEFATLSLRYATNGLGFAKIDAGRYPKAAKDFGIDTHANSKQVPSIILFKNGKEVRIFGKCTSKVYQKWNLQSPRLREQTVCASSYNIAVAAIETPHVTCAVN